ncbi:Uncharacterized conserved protein, DUF1778 family [Pseudovibrio denitrificans]|uniref:Uncharacterized conserved protein, DUF1778 family n=2 Tax=Pseudovibrio denitrificans TaxID=258256 RepID=A0A1I7AV61_9HYPH|nr:Uncharacterized conserved protein, DUF1778 family [Pseudovibrio denitrificans]
MRAASKDESRNVPSQRRPKQFRMPEHVAQLIDRVAKMQGRSQTDVVIDAATRYAEDELLDQTKMVWDEAGYDAFSKAVEGPAKPSEYVVKARQRKRSWE